MIRLLAFPLLCRGRSDERQERNRGRAGCLLDPEPCGLVLDVGADPVQRWARRGEQPGSPSLAGKTWLAGHGWFQNGNHLRVSCRGFCCFMPSSANESRARVVRLLERRLRRALQLPPPCPGVRIETARFA